MEEELEAILRGQYSLSFMQIRIAEELTDLQNEENVDIGELIDHLPNDALRATLLHEYIHYLQNVSTPFGLFCSMIDYERVAEDFVYVQKINITENDIPIKVDYSDNVKKGLQRKIAGLQIQKCHNGKSWPQIDQSKIISINIEKKDYKYFQCDIPYFIYNSINGTTEKVYLGAWIIYEYMAALFQSYINPNVSHPDVPYNILDVFLKQIYPEIYKDKAKIVALLYMALFDINPGLAFMNRLKEANGSPQLKATELFDNFVNNHKVTDSKGNQFTPKDFLQYIIDKFKNVLESLLNCKLDYIDEVLNRVNMADRSVPLITIISDGLFNVDRMKALMSHLGIPYLYSELGGYFYPKSVKNEGKESDDMISLIGVSALDSYLIKKKCSLSYLCNGMSQKPECFTLPWKGKPCVMTSAAGIIGV